MKRKKSGAGDKTGARAGAPALLTHLDRRGRIAMVDVGVKALTRREALARAALRMKPATLAAILQGSLKKGEALGAARLAGIMAAKRVHELIPLCHQIALDAVDVEFRADGERGRLDIQARARTTFRTGVEMEALLAASVAALTVYDMAKAIDRGMTIEEVRLVSKSGGRSGDFVHPKESP